MPKAKKTISKSTKKRAQKKTTILLIDDDASLRKVYEMQFEAYPEFAFYTVESTQEAERMIQKIKPDLILLDLILGNQKGVPLDQRSKTHGFNFLHFLKLEKPYRHIPVVIFTNLDNQKDRRRAMDAGASDYLVKGRYLPSELVQEIKNILEKERALAKLMRK